MSKLDPKKQAPKNARTRLSPVQRKQQLLLAAISCFSERGIGRATHADIAEATSVSVATVFNYFNTREDLVDAVLNQIEDFFLDFAKSFHFNKHASEAPLSTITEHSLSFLVKAGEHPNLIKIWLEWSASVRQDTWPRYIAFHEQMLDIIEPTIRAGLSKGEFISQLPPRDLARILYGQAHPVTLATFSPNASMSHLKRFVELSLNTVLGVHPPNNAEIQESLNE